MLRSTQITVTANGMVCYVWAGRVFQCLFLMCGKSFQDSHVRVDVIFFYKEANRMKVKRLNFFFKGNVTGLFILFSALKCAGA